MLSLEETAAGICSGSREHHPSSILYSILSGRGSGYTDGKPDRAGGAARNCHCQWMRTVCLKDPKVASQAASDVAVKTFRFIRGLPSFCQLPAADQASLLRHCWVHLFVLGLAQEQIALEVTDAPDSSFLRQILLMEEDCRRPTLAEVHRLRAVMNHLWTLELSPKEYAYLKGALLFNPAVLGLRALTSVRGLQREAQRALREVVHLLHPGDASRFSRVLLAASAVQSISHHLVSQLFLKPVLDHKKGFPDVDGDGVPVVSTVRLTLLALGPSYGGDVTSSCFSHVHPLCHLKAQQHLWSPEKIKEINLESKRLELHLLTGKAEPGSFTPGTSRARPKSVNLTSRIDLVLCGLMTALPVKHLYCSDLDVIRL